VYTAIQVLPQRAAQAALFVCFQALGVLPFRKALAKMAEIASYTVVIASYTVVIGSYTVVIGVLAKIDVLAESLFT